MGDLHARSVHGLDAHHSAGGKAALRRRLHQGIRSVDHLRDRVRAADCRSGDQLAAQSPPVRAHQGRHQPHSRTKRPEPPLRVAGRPSWRALRAAWLGCSDRDRPNPDVHPLLQYLDRLRLSLLPRFPPLFEGRGGVRLQGVWDHHDDDRHLDRRLSVPENRPAPNDPHRSNPAGVRQFRLCRPRRRRSAHRRRCAPASA